ncbi:MAG: HIT domain-containing protein [Candidatus Eisenbacteria bacterium]
MDEVLWAGWRMKYIESAKPGDACLFCEKAESRPNEKDLVLLVSEKSLVMLNAFPYNCGHLMVAPRRHVGQISNLTATEWQDLFKQLSLCERILKQAYRAQGFNVGMNLGRCAGAGVLGHLHVHVVPRWAGDTNYMSTVSFTKVMPETLRDTYRKLRKAVEGGGGSGSGKDKHGPKKARRP